MKEILIFTIIFPVMLTLFLLIKPLNMHEAFAFSWITSFLMTIAATRLTYLIPGNEDW